MDNALTPREIQARVRSGASVADVAAESGMDLDRVEAFAGPVLAEREYIASSAQSATVRRRGETGSHRKLGSLIEQRLTARGIDAEALSWDAWRQSDLKWRVVAALPAATDAEARSAEFVFDPKARFSVADNEDARWMIGEEARGGSAPEEESTVDFHDELALVRAVTQPEAPGDEVPNSELMLDGNEDTSQLDRLYDMLSGISEDSVRIYTGILDPAEPEQPVKVEIEEEETVVVAPLPPEKNSGESAQSSDSPASAPSAPSAASAPSAPSPAEAAHDPEADEPTVQVLDGPEEPTQDALVDTGETPKKAPKTRRRRAKVPSWDEIMFGGPTK